MELANVMLALGGDKGNTVPKMRVTAAEIAVLCSIHGMDSVFDVEPLGESVNVSATAEVERLLMLYPAKNEDNQLIVLTVYPGRTPVLHQSIADLGLPDEQFKATAHDTPVAPAKPKALKPAAEAKPKPVAETARDPSNADHLFEEEPDDVTT